MRFKPDLGNGRGARLTRRLRASLIDIPMGSAKGRVSVWSNNVLDKREIAFAREIFFAVGQFQVPRTFGVDLAVDF